MVATTGPDVAGSAASQSSRRSQSAAEIGAKNWTAYQGKILLVSALLYGAGFAFFGVAPSFTLALLLLTFVGAVDTIWASARSTILQWVAPDRLRGRVMGIFQLSNQGLNPLGQVETGLLVPVVGARAATVIGGLIVSAVTIATSLKLSELPRFSLDAPRPEPTRVKALPNMN